MDVIEHITHSRANNNQNIQTDLYTFRFSYKRLSLSFFIQINFNKYKWLSHLHARFMIVKCVLILLYMLSRTVNKGLYLRKQYCPQIHRFILCASRLVYECVRNAFNSQWINSFGGNEIGSRCDSHLLALFMTNLLKLIKRMKWIKSEIYSRLCVWTSIHCQWKTHYNLYYTKAICSVFGSDL